LPSEKSAAASSEAIHQAHSFGGTTMSEDTLPLLENWYQDAEIGRSFRVVAVDEENDAIDIQYLNGDIGEMDFSSWSESAIVSIEPPEDWSAPFDDVEVDDLGYTDPDRHAPDQSALTLDDLLDDESY
jgi:hypothetical protein